MLHTATTSLRDCIVGLCELLADSLNVDSLNEHALHELLPLLQLLTQLSRTLLVLLSSQVVGLEGLEELGLWV
jgi:hypothetical protein